MSVQANAKTQAGARGKSRVLHRSLKETPPTAIGGHGVWLVGANGREVLDASGGRRCRALVTNIRAC